MTPVRAVLASTLVLVIAPGTVTVLVPWLITDWRSHPPLLGLPALRAVGVLLILVGAIPVLESFARFALKGRGTPAPILPPERLVVSGFYRYVRNPMYVGIVCLVLGQALLFGDPRLLVYCAVLALGFHLFVVGHEEPALRRKFGSDYERYRAHVARWLPRLAPWHGEGPSP